ncbi:MAG: SGNH/GDSL hydrolase family protein [Marmoricola sp.]
MTRGALACCLLLVGVALGGCFAPTQQPPPPEPAHFTQYVALGDTFAAAPGTGPTRPDRGCRRSKDAYPTQVAHLLGIGHATNVACDGATTRAAMHAQRTRTGRHVPPQVHAVSSHTDLVTISLGASDHHMLSSLQHKCAYHRVACTLAPYQDKLMALTETVRTNLDEAVRAVQDRAPHATIVVVGYPRHVTVRSRCRDMPLTTPNDRAAWTNIDRALALQLSRVARDTGAEYVDTFAASAGHEICSRHPWVRGRTGAPHHGVAYGPTRAGSRAIGHLVVRAARRAASTP